MLDVERTEAAERELNRFIESRAKGREAANEEAARQRAEDRRRLAEMHREHKVLWIEHYRRLTITHLEMAKDFRRRARALAGQ